MNNNTCSQNNTPKLSHIPKTPLTSQHYNASDVQLATPNPLLTQLIKNMSEFKDTVSKEVRKMSNSKHQIKSNRYKNSNNSISIESSTASYSNSDNNSSSFGDKYKAKSRHLLKTLRSDANEKETQFKKNLSFLKQENHKLKEILKDYTAQIVGLESNMKRFRNEKVDLENTVEKISSEFSLSKKTEQSLYEEREKMVGSFYELQENLNEQKRLVYVKKEKLSSFKTKFSEETVRLSDQINILEGEKQLLEQKLYDSDQQIKQECDQRQHLESEIQRMRSEFENSQNKVFDSREECHN